MIATILTVTALPLDLALNVLTTPWWVFLEYVSMIVGELCR